VQRVQSGRSVDVVIEKHKQSGDSIIVCKDCRSMIAGFGYWHCPVCGDVVCHQCVMKVSCMEKPQPYYDNKSTTCKECRAEDVLTS
jgi:hypothetical protein